MDSAALLDLLGNENRRRILRLLSRKPCYVTEISEYLGVSPKAVIEHLRKLEDAGLVESRVDDQRRKYFHISRNVRLEVNVSPYGFGTKSAYPASKSLDITACRYLSVDTQSDASEEDPRSLAREIDRLEQLDRELSMAQRWVQGRLTDALDRIAEAAGMETGSRLAADVLVELQEGPADHRELSEAVDAPPEVLAEVLDGLEEGDLVRKSGEEWELAE